MHDRGMVMSWLEGLAEPDWMDCYSESEVQNTAIAALDLLDELLKEQKEKMEHLNNITLEYEKEVFRLQTLLNEQGNAMKRNPVIVCPHCGKRVK